MFSSENLKDQALKTIFTKYHLSEKSFQKAVIKLSTDQTLNVLHNDMSEDKFIDDHQKYMPNISTSRSQKIINIIC